MSLKDWLIKLGSEHPDLQEHLRPILDDLSGSGVKAKMDDWDNTFKDYYKYSGESLEEIACKWSEEKAQLQESRDAHTHFSLRKIWPLREYTWTRDTSRSGPLKIDGEFKDMKGPEKWDALKEKMEREGWKKDRPALIQVDPKGQMIVGEGNHRLAIAKELGIRKIPVRFTYKETHTLDDGVQVC